MDLVLNNVLFCTFSDSSTISIILNNLSILRFALLPCVKKSYADFRHQVYACVLHAHCLTPSFLRLRHHLVKKTKKKTLAHCIEVSSRTKDMSHRFRRWKLVWGQWKNIIIRRSSQFLLGLLYLSCGCVPQDGCGIGAWEWDGRFFHTCPMVIMRCSPKLWGLDPTHFIAALVPCSVLHHLLFLFPASF